MKKIAIIMLLLFSFVVMKAQEIGKLYGIDHEKKIVVATGRLPEGMKSFKEPMLVTATCLPSTSRHFQARVP